MTPVHPDQRLRLLDHLSQAELSLRVASRYECLTATPGHASVRAALARVKASQDWIRTKLAVEIPAPKPLLTPRQQHRAVQRRMARLVP